MRSKVAYESSPRWVSEIRLYPIVRRSLEILFAITLLLITLPVLIIAAIAIKVESPGSVFYKQERMGLNGKLFWIIKLRSMCIDAEMNGPQWAVKNDPRVTEVGKLIRKMRIDEIPQLINIICGDMSLIGPRPERPMFTEQFNKDIPGFKKRLLVKPGLTGWAQINGGYEATPAEKFKMDMYYIRKQSFRLDFKIFYRTILIIFSGVGAR